MGTALQWLGAVGGIAGIITAIVQLPKILGERKQAEGAGAKSQAEGQVGLSAQWQAEREDILRQASESRRDAEAAAERCEKRLEQINDWLNQRDFVTWRLIEMTRAHDDATYRALMMLQEMVRSSLTIEQREQVNSTMSEVRTQRDDLAVALIDMRTSMRRPPPESAAVVQPAS